MDTVIDQELKINIISALSDEKVRKILALIMREPKSVNDLVKDLDLSSSTVYRKIHDLEEMRLIAVERTILMEDGKSYNIYQAAFSAFEIKYNGRELVVRVEPNDNIVRKTFDLFFSLSR